MHVVYMLRCADGMVYVGHTGDLHRRLAQHNDGSASRFTACRRPVVLAYAEEHTTRESAVARERQIKRWTRRKKEALIANDIERLKRC